MAARRTKRIDGRYTVTVTYEDTNGKKRRHFCYGKTQAEANQKAQEARAAGGWLSGSAMRLGRSQTG